MEPLPGNVKLLELSSYMTHVHNNRFNACVAIISFSLICLQIKNTWLSQNMNQIMFDNASTIVEISWRLPGINIRTLEKSFHRLHLNLYNRSHTRSHPSRPIGYISIKQILLIIKYTWFCRYTVPYSAGADPGILFRGGPKPNKN